MKKYLVTLSDNPYIKGGLLVTISAYLANFINYLFHFLLGRFTGPVGYGEITTLYSYISLTTVPVTIFSTYLIQKISSYKANKLGYAYNLEKFFITKIKRWSILIIIFLLISPFLSTITNLSYGVSITLIPFIVFIFISFFYQSAFQGLKLFGIFAFFSLLTPIIKLISILPTISGNVSINMVAQLQLILQYLSLVFFIYLFRHKVKSYPNLRSKPIKSRIIAITKKPDFILTLFSVFGITALYSIDLILVKKFFSSENSGLFNSWNLFGKIILYLVGPIVTVSFVYFSDNISRAKKNRFLYRALSIFTAIFIIGYIGYSIFGYQIIYLFFGSKFISISKYLNLACIYGAALSIIVFINNYFLAQKNKFSLILIFLLPIYLVSFFLIDKNIVSMMYLDIYFCLFVAFIYFVAFLKHSKV